MPPLLLFLFSVTIAYGCALAFGLALRSRPRFSTTLSVVVLILACPLLIPAGEIILRAIASLVSTELAFKVADVSRLLTTSTVAIPFSDFCRFLVPFPFLLVVFQQKESLSPQGVDSRWKDVSQTIVAIGTCVLAIGFMYATSQWQAAKTSFWVDHVLKVLGFVVFLEALSSCLYRLDRLVGYNTVPIINRMIKSQTVAEFWQRYNTRVHSWFYFNLFRRTHVRLSPAVSVVLVFLANGLLHEVMFGIATSRFDGYQLLFFLAQIPAVLLSRVLRRFAARYGRTGVALAHVFTIAWMVATSILFFHGVNRIVPFYSATSWLP